MSSNELNFLVVDDDDLLRQSTKNILQSLAHPNIREASNGIEALEILRQSDAQPIDIVLCDLNMPEMDGMEFIRHLGESHANVSLIIVSSHDGALISAVKKMAAAYNVRLLGAAQKPVSREHLETFI